LILNSLQLSGDAITDVEREKLNGCVRYVETTEYQTSRNIEFTNLLDERAKNVDFGNPHHLETIRFNVDGSYHETIDNFPSLSNYNRVLWIYNSTGQKKQIEYYDEDEQLVGCMLFTYDSPKRTTIRLQDDKGETIEEWNHYLNRAGDTVRIAGYKYSTEERIRTIHVYNREKQLISRNTRINGKTTSREKYKYNSAGILIWEKTISEDGTREVFYDGNGDRVKQIETYSSSSVINTMRAANKQIYMAITVYGDTVVRTTYLKDGLVDTVSTSSYEHGGNSFTTTIKDAQGHVTAIDLGHYTRDNLGNWIIRLNLHIDFKSDIRVYSRSERMIKYYE
jgi:hypothetical protein